MAEGTVLQLLGPATGGMRRHVEALTAGVRRRGWEVVVAGPAAVLAAMGEDDGVEVAVPGRAASPGWVAAVRQLREVARARRHFLVHAHGLKAGAVAVAARVRPFVLTVHNEVLPGEGGPAEPLLRAVEQRLPGRAAAVIATSEDLGRRLRAGPAGDRVRVVPPVGPPPEPRRTPAEVRAALGVGEAPLVVGLGRLHRQKGWPVLLAALAELGRRVPGVRAVVAGTGPLADELAAEVSRLALGDVVVLAGEERDGAGLLAAADVVAVPSVWESGPLVLAEAMALGRPVVTTPVGFAPDLVTDGRTGRVVPVGDARALADALEVMLTDPVAARAMARAGQERVGELLDPERLVEEVAAVYRAVLDQR